MKAIAEDTGARLRLRGQGSGYLEGPEQVESSDPMMLCVSAPGQEPYRRARGKAVDLLRWLYADFDEFCQGKGLPAPNLKVSIHEGHRDGGLRPKHRPNFDGSHARG